MKFKQFLYFTIFFTFLFSISVFSNVRLPKLIGNGMVLQRETPIKIWGWADANEKVKVSFLDSTYLATTNSNGEWEVEILPLKPGGPYTMKISGNNTFEISNIAVGDVWLCSGQSNMETPMSRVSWIYPEEIANVDYPMIRQFYVPRGANFNLPQTDFPSGEWKSAVPENIMSFSAVGYFFATEINSKYEVPIGIINCALGGSPIEAWISEEAIKQFPHHLEEAQRFKNQQLIDDTKKQDSERNQKWYDELNRKDKAYINNTESWKSPQFDSNHWPTMDIPGYWADTEMGLVNGVVWFRKIVDIPGELTSKNAKLILGRIVDADSVFVNGEFVGSIGYQYPPRRYNIPKSVLKEGKNTIVVKVINNSGKGGFVPDKDYIIDFGDEQIDLAGQWHYQLGAEMEPLTGNTFINGKPVGLYNAMITPLLNFGIKGVLWYQGESNAGRAWEYADLLKTLIADWRQNWDMPKLPFVYAQLPNFMEAKDFPSESDWALLREAQLKTLAVPNTAMAVNIDIGEWNDIHPLNKKDVAYRLALGARKIAYGDQKVNYSGPVFQSMKIEGNKIVLNFTEAGCGLVAKGGKLNSFAIAGDDKVFKWANAEIIGDQIIVWCDEIENPVAVRYAWADNPKDANLYNCDGVPASPFRTDKW